MFHLAWFIAGPAKYKLYNGVIRQLRITIDFLVGFFLPKLNILQRFDEEKNKESPYDVFLFRLQIDNLQDLVIQAWDCAG